MSKKIKLNRDLIKDFKKFGHRKFIEQSKTGSYYYGMEFNAAYLLDFIIEIQNAEENGNINKDKAERKINALISIFNKYVSIELIENKPLDIVSFNSYGGEMTKKVNFSGFFIKNSISYNEMKIIREARECFSIKYAPMLINNIDKKTKNDLQIIME